MPEAPQTARPPGRRQRRREEVARRLLEHGLKLVAAHGLHACKVEEITAAAGVAKGTFFNHFAGKEDFVARLVDMVLTDLARRVRPLGLSPDGAAAMLAAVGGVHLRYFQLRPEAAAVIAQACSLTESGQPGREIRARLREHLDLLGRMLAPAAEHLGWPPQRARDLGLMVLATSCGFYWLSWSLDLGQDIPAPLLDRLGRVLARGLSEES